MLIFYALLVAFTSQTPYYKTTNLIWIDPSAGNGVNSCGNGDYCCYNNSPSGCCSTSSLIFHLGLATVQTTIGTPATNYFYIKRYRVLLAIVVYIFHAITNLGRIHCSHWETLFQCAPKQYPCQCRLRRRYRRWSICRLSHPRRLGLFEIAPLATKR